MEAPGNHYPNRYRQETRARVQAARDEISRTSYLALMTVYLGFAGYAAYEVALALSGALG